MNVIEGSGGRRRKEAGATLYFVAGTLAVILGVSALAIDLVALYSARNQAQRAADASALAGASMFVSSGCTSTGGCVAGGPQEALATAQAEAVASQNPVFGEAPTSATLATSFNYPNAEEPQITVNVYRDKAHGNPVPTFFAKIFGFATVDVSARATAEAYNPSGGAVPVGTSCLRPFLVPNCDPAHPVPPGDPEANTVCGSTSGNPGTGVTIKCLNGNPGCYPSYFFDPNNNYNIAHPGVYTPASNPPGGIIGEPWQLHDNAAPSQWYLLQFTGESGADIRTEIEQCSDQVIACNSPLKAANGAKVGPTDQGINDLIEYGGSSDGPNNGQDTICSPVSIPACDSLPFPITGGSANPTLAGQKFFTGSNSLVSVAVYDGQAPSSGNTFTAIVIGYMQLFVVDAQGPTPDSPPPPGFPAVAKSVDTIVVSSGGCGSSSATGGGGTPPLSGAGGTGSFIPIRLIRQ